MVVKIEVDEGASRDLAELARKLGRLGDGKTVKREFRQSLQAAVRPVANDAKAAARSLPSHRDAKGRNSLRAGIARAVGTQVKTGGTNPRVAVRVRRKSLGTAGELPRNINKGAWAHPTYGHRPIVIQRGQRGWYDDVMRKGARHVVNELESTCNKFERRLMA